MGQLGVPDDVFAELLRRLRFDRTISREAGELFHQLRLMGNRAAHDGQGTNSEALTGLKMARELGVWFCRSFGGQPGFKHGPFIPPHPPEDPTKDLRDEPASVLLNRIRAERATAPATLSS